MCFVLMIYYVFHILIICSLFSVASLGFELIEKALRRKVKFSSGL